MAQRRILTVIGLSAVVLLLLVPTASRACDPSAVLAFDILGKYLSQRAAQNYIAPAWWQGEPELLDAYFSAKDDEAEYEYLVARINDLVGAKEAAYSAYQTIQQSKKDCAYSKMATTRRGELEAVLFPYSYAAEWPSHDFCIGLDFDHPSGPQHYEPLSTPEAKAMEDTYDRTCSVQRILERPVGSHHLMPTPADEATKSAEDAAKMRDSQKYRMWDSGFGCGTITF